MFFAHPEAAEGLRHASRRKICTRVAVWIFVVTGIAGCVTTRASVETSQASATNLSIEVAASGLTPIEQAFATAMPVRFGVKGNRVEVYPTKFPVIEVGGQHVLAVPVLTDGKVTKLMVRSYIVRGADGAHTMFYPIISLVDNEFRIYRTLKPKYEFALDGDTLLNEFDIPAGTNRLIVHTDQEFFHSSFEGLIPAVQGPPERDRAVAAALGGVVGLLALQAASRRDAVTFRFSEVGIVEVEVN